MIVGKRGDFPRQVVVQRERGFSLFLSHNQISAASEGGFGFFFFFLHPTAGRKFLFLSSQTPDVHWCFAG